jgi:hypothetical protein
VVKRRDPGEVGGNVRGALASISKNEEFINMTLAMLMRRKVIRDRQPTTNSCLS